MKTLIALFFLHLSCVNSNYYMMDAVAYDSPVGTTYFSDDGNIWKDHDHNNGEVVILFDSCGTDDVTDDVIRAVIIK